MHIHAPRPRSIVIYVCVEAQRRAVRVARRVAQAAHALVLVHIRDLFERSTAIGTACATLTTDAAPGSVLASRFG